MATWTSGSRHTHTEWPLEGGFASSPARPGYGDGGSGEDPWPGCHQRDGSTDLAGSGERSARHRQDPAKGWLTVHQVYIQPVLQGSYK